MQIENNCFKVLQTHKTSVPRKIVLRPFHSPVIIHMWCLTNKIRMGINIVSVKNYNMKKSRFTNNLCSAAKLPMLSNTVNPQPKGTYLRRHWHKSSICHCHTAFNQSYQSIEHV